jgi:predicted transcriptional regulator
MRAKIRARLEAIHAQQQRKPLAVDLSEKLYTPAEVAEILQISPASVKRAFRERPGTIFLAPARRRMRIPLSVLKASLEEGQVR